MFLVVVNRDRGKGLVVDLEWFIPGSLTTDDVRFVDEYVVELSDLVEDDGWDFGDARIRDLRVKNVVSLFRVKELIDRIRLGASTSVGTGIASLLALWGVWSVFGGDVFVVDSGDLDDVVRELADDGIEVVRW